MRVHRRNFTNKASSERKKFVIELTFNLGHENARHKEGDEFPSLVVVAVFIQAPGWGASEHLPTYCFGEGRRPTLEAGDDTVHYLVFLVEYVFKIR